MKVGLSYFQDTAYQQAASTLLDSGCVDMIEWTIDSMRFDKPLPETEELLQRFSAGKNLIGHGVHYPLLSADGEGEREKWLLRAAEDVKVRNYIGISVHFGFSTGWRVREGAPLPVMLCEETMLIGRRAMRRLADVVGCEVGIENLALAFSVTDVIDQGKFISGMLDEVDGYLLLDLHNLYCQSVNFSIPLFDLAKTYPLARVREIHVSGGSWSEGGRGRKIRRDTHDGRVPDEILASLPDVIRCCPRLAGVIFEKLPQSFRTADDTGGFIADFTKVRHAVASI